MTQFMADSADNPENTGEAIDENAIHLEEVHADEAGPGNIAESLAASAEIGKRDENEEKAEKEEKSKLACK